MMKRLMTVQENLDKKQVIYKATPEIAEAIKEVFDLMDFGEYVTVNSEDDYIFINWSELQLTPDIENLERLTALQERREHLKNERFIKEYRERHPEFA